MEVDKQQEPHELSQYKREFVDLNTGEDPQMDDMVKAMGGYRLAVQKFGTETADRTEFMRVKELLRSGRVVMVRAEVRPNHVANIKWFTQMCRTAHRAGVPWALRLRLTRPWQIPPLMALKRLSYVCLRKRSEGQEREWHDLTSNGLELDQLEGQEFVRQVRCRA